MAIFNIAYQLIDKLKRAGVQGNVQKASGDAPTKAEFDALVEDYNKLVNALKDKQ